MSTGSLPPFRLNDLRMRVLEGEDIPAEEMLLIVNDIRRDRRAAVRASDNARTSMRRKANPGVPVTTENLKAILDQEMEG